MRTDGEATKQRIIVAARAEFAQHGLSGARVDRIASAANASKERLYAYFGNKVDLFRAVLDLNRIEVIEAIPIDVADLPGFAGRIFDHSVSNPEHLRMLDWARLEGIQPSSPETEKRLSIPELALRNAQAEGRIDSDWNASDLMAMLMSLALTWANTPGILDQPGGAPAELRERHRDSLVRAVLKIIDPAPHSSA